MYKCRGCKKFCWFFQDNIKIVDPVFYNQTGAIHKKCVISSSKNVRRDKGK